MKLFPPPLESEPKLLTPFSLYFPLLFSFLSPQLLTCCECLCKDSVSEKSSVADSTVLPASLAGCLRLFLGTEQANQGRNVVDSLTLKPR